MYVMVNLFPQLVLKCLLWKYLPRTHIEWSNV